MASKRNKNSVKANFAKFHYYKKKRYDNYAKVSLKGLSGFSWVHFSEDPIFNDYLFNKFVGLFVKAGKKDKVLKIMYSLFGMSHKKRIPYYLFYNIIERLKLGVVCVPTRYRDVIMYVPMPTTEAKAYRIAVQFLYKAIRDRKHDKTMQEKIFNEFEAFFKEPGYKNSYWETETKLAQESSYLRHFRRFGVY